MVIFRAEDHTYWDQDVQFPSVTTILRSAGLVNIDWCTDFGRDKGTAIHACIALDIAKKLDEDSVDPQVRPYLEQWRAFRNITNIEVLASEKLVWSNTYGYAGTEDLYCRFNGRYFILDFKTNQMPRWVSAQLGGYSIAMREADFAVDGVGCLVLKEKTFKLCCTDRTVAESEFMAALSKAKGVPA